MPGLEKLLRGLYGSTPQLDMERYFAKVRVTKAMELDFAHLADGMKRANVDPEGIQVEADVAFGAGTVTFTATGQSFPLEGTAPASEGSSRRRFRVLDWGDKSRTRLEIVP